MLLTIGVIICFLIMGFVETYFYMSLAARLAEANKESGINIDLNEIREAVSKGNRYTSLIEEHEWVKFKWFRRIRFFLVFVFVVSIFFN
ncbi:hypothetical protein N473_18095 [Pseudoalteromonas luteoviolacea CPMOR-1]|uniref:CNNM transmembrane domain-containing protein n=1 Tax=Pseudoalteromonas luteoviolacea CPMOR-1 TaxID=1365248 RepID=A0A167KI07_9GAMM|nr:hypothetical protein [Pseudoalteromonas luteoviolacea]KZN62826.1 hypothetical protein N473_18095 [Pseudoalteromonas luteoviolacea CPMOR-1]